MKSLFSIIMLVLSSGSFASTLLFNCKSLEAAGVHKFEARGVVNIDQDNNVDGVISLKVQKAQVEDSVQVFNDIKIKGTYIHVDAGKISEKPFDQLTLMAINPYIKNLNILLNFDISNISQVATVDNFIYRSNCEMQ